MSYINFQDLPLEVQVAAIEAAGKIAAAEITALGDDYCRSFNFFGSNLSVVLDSVREEMTKE